MLFIRLVLMVQDLFYWTFMMLYIGLVLML